MALELVFNSAFSDAMRATFPVITLGRAASRAETTAADFTDLATWHRTAKGGYLRWHKGTRYTIYRSLNGRWRYMTRVVEDVQGEYGQVFKRPWSYFSVKSFPTPLAAIKSLARGLGM